MTAPGELASRERFVSALRRFPEVKSIHWAVNDRPAEVTNLPTELLWGDEWIEEEILGKRFRVRPNAFLQTNTAMCERLYGLALEYAGLTGTETVYDLYCGIGTIGISLAADALTVWGVETSEESVACALENAELNGITNSAFFAGDTADSLEELRERSGQPDVVVLDPPRAGLSGKALRPGRPPRGAEDRLRLVQPDHARGKREGARVGVRLHARPRAARGHVPAHAAHRSGRALHPRVARVRHDAASDATPWSAELGAATP